MSKFIILYYDLDGEAIQQVGCAQGVRDWLKRHQVSVDDVTILEVNRECSMSEFIDGNTIPS